VLRSGLMPVVQCAGLGLHAREATMTACMRPAAVTILLLILFTGLFYRRALSFVLLGRSYLTMLQASQPGPTLHRSFFSIPSCRLFFSSPGQRRSLWRWPSEPAVAEKGTRYIQADLTVLLLDLVTVRLFINSLSEEALFFLSFSIHHPDLEVLFLYVHVLCGPTGVVLFSYLFFCLCLCITFPYLSIPIIYAGS
jgi:hypothetical protein